MAKQSFAPGPPPKDAGCIKPHFRDFFRTLPGARGAIDEILGAGKPASTDRLRMVKLDHMGCAEVHVRSAVEDEDALGGFAVFGATQQPLAESLDGDGDQAIGLVVGHERSVPYGNGFSGITLIIANVSDAQIALSASDSRIRVVQEALDEDGQRRPIEVLPSSWCGNSYHTVYLRLGHAWHVAAARYGGALKTQLRFRLSRGQTGDVVSNTFPGAINVGVFTTKKARQPRGIMDPQLPTSASKSAVALPKSCSSSSCGSSVRAPTLAGGAGSGGFIRAPRGLRAQAHAE